MDGMMDWNAIIEAGVPLPDFGDVLAEFTAARSHAVASPLTQFRVLRFHGDDAQAFLHAQLTCDVARMTQQHATFGGYCTAKGRLYANFLLVKTTSGYLMILPADLAKATRERLRKFVLRSRVTIEQDNSYGLLGVAGPEGFNLLQGLAGESGVPREVLHIMGQPHTMSVRLPGEQFLVVGSSRDLPDTWKRLIEKGAVQVGAQCWNWLQIRATIPWITAATCEQFLPQMIGLDVLGGVSFDKGCFPGQEIVARSRYLGEIKRKLRLGHATGVVAVGDSLLSEARPCGTVLNAAPVPEGGSDLLAVVTTQDQLKDTRSTHGDPVVWLEELRSPEAA